jgi:streptogramin lyase
MARSPREDDMRAGHAVAGIAMVICITFGVFVAASEDATLTTWAMPYSSAFPAGLAIDAEGRVHTAAAGGREVFRLDPANDAYRSWGVGQGPQDVVLIDGVVFCTIPDEDFVVYFDPEGVSVSTRLVPFPGAGPRTIRRGADTGDGKVVLWISERNEAGILSYTYDPATDAPMAVGVPSDQTATPTSIDVVPTVWPAAYEQYAYNVGLIPDPELLSPLRTAGAFTEWRIPVDIPPGIADLAVAMDETLWISGSLPFLYRMDPDAGTLQALETIQNVIIANGLLPASDGSIWFGNLLEGAIGHFDPNLGISEVWRIPGTGEVYDLAFGPDGAVWYTDRAGSAIGRLDVEADQATVYPLAEDSEPLDLFVDADGSVWFVAGSGNYIGRLEPHEAP